MSFHLLHMLQNILIKLRLTIVDRYRQQGVSTLTVNIMYVSYRSVDDWSGYKIARLEPRYLVELFWVESKSLQKRVIVLSTLLNIVNIGHGKMFWRSETGVDTGVDMGGYTIWNTYSRFFSHVLSKTNGIKKSPKKSECGVSTVNHNQNRPREKFWRCRNGCRHGCRHGWAHDLEHV